MEAILIGRVHSAVKVTKKAVRILLRYQGGDGVCNENPRLPNRTASAAAVNSHNNAQMVRVAFSEHPPLNLQ